MRLTVYVAVESQIEKSSGLFVVLFSFQWDALVESIDWSDYLDAWKLFYDVLGTSPDTKKLDEIFLIDYCSLFTESLFRRGCEAVFWLTRNIVQSYIILFLWSVALMKGLPYQFSNLNTYWVLLKHSWYAFFHYQLIATLFFSFRFWWHTNNMCVISKFRSAVTLCDFFVCSEKVFANLDICSSVIVNENGIDIR